MATNFDASIFAKGQAIVTANVQQYEQRRRMPTVMELALKNQKFSNPNLPDLRVSPLRPTEAYYRKNIAAGSTVTKAAFHTGTYGDTATTTVVYVSHVENISVPLKVGANNLYDDVAIFADAYQMAWANLRTRHDTSALALLYSGRCQLSAAVMNAQLATAGLQYWDEGTGALKIPVSLNSLFMQKAKDAMRARNFVGQYDIVADLQMATNFANYYNQGAGNQTNTNWQFGDANVVPSNTVLDSNYSGGTVFIMPKGTLYGLNWNEQANLRGIPPQMSDGSGSIGSFTTASDPFGSGGVADVSFYSQRIDTSANTYSGSPQDIQYNMEVTLTIGYVLPPLSTTNDSTLMEIYQEVLV